MLRRSATAFAPPSLIAVALALIVAPNPASGASVDTQVTDAVTQANVKVVASSPAMSMGAIYQSTANSTGLQMNNSPGLVTHAQAVTTQGVQQIYTVDTAAGALPASLTTRMNGQAQDSRAKVLRKIDAMAQRLAECEGDCLLNLHFHTPTGPARDARTDSCSTGDFDVTGTDIVAQGMVTPAQLLATCIVARMETKTGVPVEGVAWVIEDAPAGTSLPVTRVDMYVQRLP